jgi:hypothetical protein
VVVVDVVVAAVVVLAVLVVSVVVAGALDVVVVAVVGVVAAVVVPWVTVLADTVVVFASEGIVFTARLVTLVVGSTVKEAVTEVEAGTSIGVVVVVTIRVVDVVRSPVLVSACRPGCSVVVFGAPFSAGPMTVPSIPTNTHGGVEVEVVTPAMEFAPAIDLVEVDVRNNVKLGCAGVGGALGTKGCVTVGVGVGPDVAADKVVVGINASVEEAKVDVDVSVEVDVDVGVAVEVCLTAGVVAAGVVTVVLVNICTEVGATDFGTVVGADGWVSSLHKHGSFLEHLPVFSPPLYFNPE